MFQKWICFLLSVGVVFLTAGEGKGAEQTGTVQVIPVWCDRQVMGGTVSLCRIGSRRDTGIEVTDGLANWMLEEEDLLSDGWYHWILQRSGEEKRMPVTDAGAEFTGLEEGVYLVRQMESNVFFSCFQPFLVSVPTDGNWVIVKKPPVIGMVEVPKTGDHPAPIIGAMGIGFSVAVLMVLMDGRKK